MAKKLTKKQIEANIKAAQEARANKKVMYVDPEETIDVPIVGSFRIYLEESMNYLFSLHEEDEIVVALEHIRTGFENIPEDAPVNPFMNALWTLMSLQTEINLRAVEQGKVIITDEDHSEELQKIIKSFETFNDEDLKKAFKQSKADYETMRKEDEAAARMRAESNEG